ncbi:MAG: putative toxin-antitoxin system toxin component, PIN family [Cyanobacteria bacterium]|nr:putative toxin-antitoxin system toxin component, PIN family [Cyanobacteriota bacterium]
MLKVVVDANVWISGLIVSQGQPAKVIDLFRAGAFVVCISADLLDELQEVLKRPRIAARIDETDGDQLIELIKSQSIVALVEAVPTVSRDPKDDVYLACAAAVDADVLITGDQDLLVLKTHGRTRILTPGEFLTILDTQ